MTEIPFELINRRSYSIECPECGPTRSKKGTKSLSVYRDEDGMIRAVCNHAGQCSMNTWHSYKDPRPEDINKLSKPVAVMPVPEGVELPTEYMGDKLYWYRDLEGRGLFASRRIQISPEVKLPVPYIYTADGFKTGKGTEWPKPFTGLYGAQTIPGANKAVIVEGEKAAEAAMEIFPGYAVVSWKGGANSGFREADWHLLKDMEAILLWPDNDEPGHTAMNEIARRLPCANVMIADVYKYPKGWDLADPISEEDRIASIKNATKVEARVEGVWSLEAIEKQMSELRPARPTGFDLIDSRTKLPGSGLLIIEGRTKHGKSGTAVALASSLLHKELERSVLYYSYEMTAAAVFLRFMRTLNPNISKDNYRGTEEFNKTANLINSGALKIVDQSAQLTIGDIVIAAGKPTIRGGIIIVDYLQIVPTTGNFSRSTRQQILKEMLDELRVEAHKNNVLVVILSQLTPDYINPDNDAPREAKDIHYSADMVIRIWNKAVGETYAKYNSLSGSFVLHVYLNRDGEPNVKYEGHMIGGSQLKLSRIIKE